MTLEKCREFYSVPDIPQKNCFTFIRLVLCLFVVFDHTAKLALLGCPTEVSVRISVPAFFIISGFWISKSFFSSKNIKDFAIKRIVRIFPQLFFVLWFCAFSFVCFSTLSPKEYFSSPLFFRYMMKTLIQFTGVNLPGVFENSLADAAVNGSCWTIHIEVLFYVILPAIIFIVTLITVKLNTKKMIWGGGEVLLK